MVQSSERIASMDLSGAGACEWYSIINCPANILLEYMSIPALTAKNKSPWHGGQFHIGRRTHGRDQTVIGKHDDIGQAGWIPDVLRAEVKQGLLDHAVGQVCPKSLGDVAGEAHNTGVVVDLGEIGGHSHRVGARGRGHRG